MPTSLANDLFQSLSPAAALCPWMCDPAAFRPPVHTPDCPASPRVVFVATPAGPAQGPPAPGGGMMGRGPGSDSGVCLLLLPSILGCLWREEKLCQAAAPLLLSHSMWAPGGSQPWVLVSPSHILSWPHFQGFPRTQEHVHPCLGLGRNPPTDLNQISRVWAD